MIFLSRSSEGPQFLSMGPVPGDPVDGDSPCFCGYQEQIAADHKWYRRFLNESRGETVCNMEMATTRQFIVFLVLGSQCCRCCWLGEASRWLSRILFQNKAWQIWVYVPCSLPHHSMTYGHTFLAWYHATIWGNNGQSSLIGSVVPRPVGPSEKVLIDDATRKEVGTRGLHSRQNAILQRA